jgi:signal transduction histidine kinase/CheY-like chemotaxis protein
MSTLPAGLCLALALAASAGRLFGWSDSEAGKPLVLSQQQAATLGASGPVLSFCAAPNGDVFFGADRIFLDRGMGFCRGLSEPRGYGFRALAAGPDGRIWLGADEELGYLEMDAEGEYRFVSLMSQFVSAFRRGPGQIQAAAAAGNGAVFVGEHAVYHWNGAEFEEWKLGAAESLRLVPLHPAEGVLWVYVPGFGIFVLGEKGPVLGVARDKLPGEPLWILAPPKGGDARFHSPDGWMVGVPGMVFSGKGACWTPLDGLSRALGGIASCAVALDEAQVAIGTRTQGAVIADRSGRIASRIDIDDGLDDNQVSSLWRDPAGDLWVGTSSGASRFRSPSALSVFNQGGGRPIGAVRCIEQAGASLYVATVRGVFRLAPRREEDDTASLQTVAAPPGPVLALGRVGWDLVAGGVGGLWVLEGSYWRTILEARDAVQCCAPARQRAALFLAADNGLMVADRADGKWRVQSLRTELDDPPESILDDGDGHLWVSTATDGLEEFGILWSPTGAARLALIARFQPGKGLPGHTVRPVLAIGGRRVAIFAGDQILQLDGEKKAFEPIPAFSAYRGIAAGEPDAQGRAIWVVSRRNWAPGGGVCLLEVEADTNGAWKATPLASGNVARAGMPSRIACFGTAQDRVIWFGGTTGVERADLGSWRSVDPVPPPVRVTAVLHSVARPAEGSRPRGWTMVRDRLASPSPLGADTQSIHFEVFVRARDREDVYFQSQLVGLEEDWTAPAAYPVRDFTGLAAGNYEFRIRAVDGFGNAGPVTAYRFRRLAAWYVRWPAVLGYCGAAVLGVAGGIRWRVRRLRRQNERLNRMVSERTRELAMTNSAKMQFLSNISHEIRNPLNGIVGLVGMLNALVLGPRERELAASLAACAASLRRVFDQVLGFARLEEGRVEVKEAPFALRPLLEEIVRLFSAEAAQRGCPLTLEVSGDESELVGDGEKVRTIVSNFVANALKYAPGRPVEIRCSLDPAASGPQADGDRLRFTIEVSDHGPGIPDEEQELIFRKFVRGASSANRNEPGAGLGLATCQALARLLGGSIGVESTVGGGSTFFFRVGMRRAGGSAAADGALMASLPQAPVDHAPASPGPRALVVEDQEYNQLVAGSILERLGYVVDFAANAHQAREYIQAGGYLLALFDWDVPGAEGGELVRHLRAQPGGAATIALAATAHDTRAIRGLCLGAGMDGFLVKPLDEAMISEAVRTVRARQGGSAAPDFRIFGYLGRGDAAKTRAVAVEYDLQLEREVGLLDEALAAGDVAAVAARAHRLCSHAAVVRCEGLAAAARRLQNGTALLRDPAGLAAAVAEVRRQARTLRELIGSMQAG